MSGPADPALPGTASVPPAVPGRPHWAPPGDAGPRLSGRSVLIGFAVIVGICLVLAVALALLSDAPEPPPDCQPGTECGGPPGGGVEASAEPTPVDRPSTPVSTPLSTPASSAAAIPAGTVGIRAGIPVINTTLGYEFEYSDWWAIDSSNPDPTETDFQYQGTSGDGELIVAAVPATEASAQAYADRWFAKLKDWAPDLKADESAKNAILGPEIGFVDGIGRSYAGSRSSPQSATTPIGVSVVVASDGRTTAAVILIVWNPDKPVRDIWLQHNIRSRAELILKTFRWGPVP